MEGRYDGVPAFTFGLDLILDGLRPSSAATTPRSRAASPATSESSGPRRARKVVGVAFIDAIKTVRDSLSARTVYAEPYERDGITVIAAATVYGGGGGGSGDEPAGKVDGAGFGLVARPSGAFVIQRGTVRWKPAIDVPRLIGVTGAVMVALVLAHRRGR
ncbi:hypothetical protein [Alloactinosynnema sp. L-07]|uniref:hypothetical protein n=1 Tax=Alloactinosynnema sp. L-07 TaxID=1653480 RepID=UPI00065EF9B3|nr:hypothetical protein [Alloactinosynnema sp. L-07]CRK57573.1 hypothetical protein [Alloactinosynnema sp. L-07]